jgi:hypothetical protein
MVLYNVIRGVEMNIIVHLLIARSVRKTVSEQIGARLSLTGFLYGNILPDISSKYDEIPHFFKDSMEFVLDSAEQLRKGLDDNRRISSFAYSRQVGVITHYLSDFCCYAHSEQYNDNIYKHHFYEFQMLFLFRRGLLFYQRRKHRGPLNLPDLKACIVRYAQSYNNGTHHLTRDIYCALNVSGCVTICLLRDTMLHEGNKIFSNHTVLNDNEMYCDEILCREAN